MAEKSEKTKMIESAKVEDEGRFGIPAMVKGALTAGAKAEDYIREKLGMKPAEAPSTDKKAKGGSVAGYEYGGEVEEDMPARSSRMPTRPPARPKGNKTIYVKSGGKISSASSRADGIAQRGKTRGRIV